MAGVPVQRFANRADVPGGSTLGNLQANTVPVPTADIGLPQLAIADLAADMRVLKEAQSAAEELLHADPGLTAPEHAPLLARVRRLFADHGDMFN